MPLKPSLTAEIYDVPLGEFVRTRNAIAARLRAAGKDAEARAVRAIAKPRATVWAINKVARAAPRSIAQLLSAFDRLKRAQLRRPDEIGAAADALRERIEDVVHRATAAMDEGGLGVGVDTRRRLAATLRGAAAAARERLEAGALTEEMSAPGFELFGGATPRPRGARRRWRSARSR